MEVKIINYNLIELVPASDAEEALLNLWAEQTNSPITDDGTMRIGFKPTYLKPQGILCPTCHQVHLDWFGPQDFYELSKDEKKCGKCGAVVIGLWSKKKEFNSNE